MFENERLRNLETEVIALKRQNAELKEYMASFKNRMDKLTDVLESQCFIQIINKMSTPHEWYEKGPFLELINKRMDFDHNTINLILDYQNLKIEEVPEQKSKIILVSKDKESKE